MIKLIDKNTWQVITSTTNKLANFMKPTYGPDGKKCIIDKGLYKMVVDDGVQIARDFELQDDAERAVLNVIKEVAIRTNDRVGDGTTGSVIVLQGIVKEVNVMPFFSGRLIEAELKKGFAEAKAQIEAKAQPIKTLQDLEKVARISFDNEEVSKTIAEAWYAVGAEGVVTVEKSATMETTKTLTDGLKISNGYISPYMITDGKAMEAVIEKPYILITNYRLTEASDILPVMNMLIKEKEKRDLVVICENMEQTALATAVLNRMQGKFNLLAVCAPKGTDNFLEDMALATGATIFGENSGKKVNMAIIADLGRASKVISRQTETVIIDPKGDAVKIKKSTEELRAAVTSETDPKKKELLAKRLARFTNKIAVVKVGGATENEQKALKYKVEDAVNAVKSAYKGGIVCGAGLTLARVNTSSPILNAALKQPFRQICINSGLAPALLSNLKKDEAVDARTGETGNFLKLGIVDAADALIAGLESAVSIASILVTTYGIEVETLPEENKNA